MAAERNITIYQGDTYLHELRLRNSANANINISSRTYSGQVRKTSSSSNSIAVFTTAVTDGANGVVQFSIASSVTANIKSGVYYYDFQEVNGSFVTTLIAGKVSLQGEVTRVG
jgi:hypothetical protein